MSTKQRAPTRRFLLSKHKEDYNQDNQEVANVSNYLEQSVYRRVIQAGTGGCQCVGMEDLTYQFAKNHRSLSTHLCQCYYERSQLLVHDLQKGQYS